MTIILYIWCQRQLNKTNESPKKQKFKHTAFERSRAMVFFFANHHWFFSQTIFSCCPHLSLSRRIFDKTTTTTTNDDKHVTKSKLFSFKAKNNEYGIRNTEKTLIRFKELDFCLLNLVN